MGIKTANQGETHGQHRESDFARPEEAAFKRLHPLFDVARNVFQYYNGIVTTKPVATVSAIRTGCPGCSERDTSHQTYRSRIPARPHRDQHGANVAQKQEYHENHQTHGNHQRPLDFTQRRADGGGLV